MRRLFFKVLYEEMKKNKNVWALTGDLGFGGFDLIQHDFDNRFVNCGASERAMLGIACGLALKGKIVFCYSITPFLLWTPAEVIRLYINHENLTIKLVASGRDKDYLHDGFSHDGTDAKGLLNLFPNIECCWPQTKEEIPNLIKEIIKNNKPTFLSLKR